MTDHHCTTWQTKTEWRSEQAEQNWNIQRHYRVQRCTECGQERIARPMPHQRRFCLQSQAGAPQELLQALSPKQWRSVDQLLKTLGGNRLEVEQTLESWLRAGWIEVEENLEAPRGEWQKRQARLTEAAHKKLVAEPMVEREGLNQLGQTSALAILAGWETDLQQADQLHNTEPVIAPLLHRLAVVLQEQAAALTEGQWTPIAGTSQRVGGPVHQRWLRILRALLSKLATQTWDYERSFSTRWLGDSKQLARDRRQVETYLGITLEQLGLFRHTPVVYCWGAFRAECDGRNLDGMAGAPFVAVAAETIRQVSHMQVSAAHVLVIENQTAFEMVLRPPLRQATTLYLFSSGHAGYAERELLANWLRAKPELPWYLWTDLDLGGVRIQLDWAHWAAMHGLPAPIPWQWDETALNRWASSAQPMSERQRSGLQAFDHPLARQLLAAGFTLEQEGILTQLVPDDFSDLSASRK